MSVDILVVSLGTFVRRLQNYLESGQMFVISIHFLDTAKI